MAQGDKPSHKICVGQESGEKTFWTEIGACWEHSKGMSCKIIPSISLTGEFQIFENKPKEES